MSPRRTSTATRQPPIHPFRQEAMHRLIPSRFSRTGTVLSDVAETPALLAHAAYLDGATNDRIQGEIHGLSGISTFELVYGIPNAHIVNAAFTHASEASGRFHDRTRGAWYAAQEQETSLAEVAYHKSRHLAEMIVPELPGERPDRELSTYDDWLADFRAAFNALDPAAEYADCLVAEPVPACYAASERLAHDLLHQRSNGILYPSVRRAGGHCLVCFRPALVHDPRPGERLAIEFRASGEGYRHRVTRRSHFDPAKGYAAASGAGDPRLR